MCIPKRMYLLNFPNVKHRHAASFQEREVKKKRENVKIRTPDNQNNTFNGGEGDGGVNARYVVNNNISILSFEIHHFFFSF